MKRTILALGALVFLVSCSSAPPEPAPMPPPATPTGPPAIVLPRAPEPARDQCGLKEAQAFLGKNRTELPAPVDPSRWRVACTTCPVTMDFREDRLNILFNADTGIVQQVKCG